MRRIKTEAEFERERGEQWRSNVVGGFNWNSPAMDYLFGKTIPDKPNSVGEDHWQIMRNERNDMVWVISKDMTIEFEIEVCEE